MTAGVRLYRLLAVLLMLAVVVIWVPGLLVAWWFAAVVVLAAALIDAMAGLRRVPVIEVERDVAGSLPVGVWSTVRLSLRLVSGRGRWVEIMDHFPPQAAVAGLPRVIYLSDAKALTVAYALCPQRRGEARFEPIAVRSGSPLGLWRRHDRYGVTQTIRVYPDFRAVMQYATLATAQHLRQIGIHRQRRRGEGLEFQQLREFREGDRLAQIDWNATARLRKPISREFQEERDQDVIFLLDCGRRMLAQDDALSYFDHCLNAVLLLAYVAMREGDAIGLATFGGPTRWLPPRKGVNRVTTVLNALYDLQPSTAAPDYRRAANALLARQRKRALVLLLSNLRDEDRDDLVPALQALRQRHLVVLASLREPAVVAATHGPVRTLDDALLASAACDYLGRRERALAEIAAHGFYALDVTPAELPVVLVNRYLQIKERGML